MKPMFTKLQKKRVRVDAETLDILEEQDVRMAARPLSLDDLAFELEELSAKHDQLLDAASQFGMRSAAVPRNLMSYAEAKRIVDKFDDDLEGLYEFENKLQEAKRELRNRDDAAHLFEGVQKLQTKATDMAGKFRKDFDKAKKALAKWAELLTGVKFQDVFQQLRTAVIKLDPADPDGIDFEVEERPNDPKGPYAVGRVIIGPIKTADGDEVTYKVIVGYRATTDDYWGNITRGHKTYKSIATKSKGRTSKQFSRALVDQLLAIAQAKGDRIFKTRRSVKLDVLTDEEASQIVMAIKDSLPDHWNYDGYDTKARAVVIKVSSEQAGWPGPQQSLHGMVRKMDFFGTLSGYLERLPVGGPRDRWMRSNFEVVGNTDKYQLEFGNQRKGEVNMLPFIGKKGTKAFDYFRNGLASNGYIEFATRRPGLRALRKRAQDLVRNPNAVWGEDAKTIRAQLQSYQMNESGSYGSFRAVLQGTITVRKKSRKASAANIATRAAHNQVHRVVEAYRTAGGAWFEERIYEADPRRAWKQAVEDARRQYGYGHDGDGYTGSLAEKDSYGYSVERREPFSSWEEAGKWAGKQSNEKWGPAGAVSVAVPDVKEEEKITVTVKATNKRQAEQRGTLRIKSTGRIRPRVKVIVEDLRAKKLGGSRTYPEWEVTGVRKQVVFGKVTGWLFFGVASS
jgi:predicted nuclease with TOPRIM domain